MPDLPAPLTEEQDDMCEELLCNLHRLSNWEISFVESIVENENMLTPRQAACLLKIYEEKL